MITDNQTCFKTTTARIHWPAVFAGAFVGIGITFLLGLFSMAIGLSAYTAAPNGAMTIAIGGVIGLLIEAIVSMGVAGFVAGYLGRFYHCYCHGGVIYGFVTWSLALILSALLIMPIANYVAYSVDNLNINAQNMAANGTSNNMNTSNSMRTSNMNQQQNASVQQMPNVSASQLAGAGWIIFILFFVGALSCCISACCGMRCARDIENNPV